MTSEEMSFTRLALYERMKYYREELTRERAKPYSHERFKREERIAYFIRGFEWSYKAIQRAESISREEESKSDGEPR